MAIEYQLPKQAFDEALSMSSGGDHMQLYQIKMLSQASCRFYRNAMHQVDDYNIRRIFQQRFDIYQQLLNLVASVTTANQSQEDTQLNHTISWFETAQTSIDSFDNMIFLDFLDSHENVALNALKNGVKTSADKAMSAQLSQFAASLQVNHDALHALKNQYKGQGAAHRSVP